MVQKTTHPGERSGIDRPEEAPGGRLRLQHLLRRVPEIWRRMRDEADLRRVALTASEFLIIFLFGLWITSDYLNMDPATVPAGREYMSAIQTHDLWLRVQECGWCALWDGSTQGGTPAFVDLHGSMLHPLVMVTTLIWGVISGSKIALTGAFLVAGLAQWWLAHVLGVDRVARVWTACMAIAGGHLAARMELGAFGVVLSTAMVSLIFPALILVARSRRRRPVLVLGLLLGLALLAGQGYMQFGLFFTAPAILFLVAGRETNLRTGLQPYAIALGLGLLIASPFLIPFLHFLSEFGKEIDPQFLASQPLSYVPLNFLIADPDFYRSNALQKLPYPHLSAHYIGWIAILFAAWGFFKGRQTRRRRAVTYLAVTAVLAMWLASAQPLKWMVEHLPLPWLGDMLAGVRHPLQIAALAVPPILGIAAVGLDRLLHADWPQASFSLADARGARRTVNFDFRLLLVIPLLFALHEAQAFGEHWIYSEPVYEHIGSVLDSLETPDLQWVNVPHGEHFWVVAARERGLKMSNGIRTWHWRNRPLPEPVLEANRRGPPPDMTDEVTSLHGVTVYAATQTRAYATVAASGDEHTVCSASGQGGMIDVHCTLTEAGVLTVRENYWPGWRAEVNGQRLPLLPDRWLSVSLPAGEHTVQFRYRPWDVPLGIIFSLVGLSLVVYLWRKPHEPLPGEASVETQAN